MRQMRDFIRSHGLMAAVALLLALAALLATPTPLAAQSWLGRSTLPPGTTLEGYVARATLDPAVVGTRGRVAGAGAGARLLLPLQSLTRSAPDVLARRMSVGAFVTAVPATGDEVEARHYGLQADLRLVDAAVDGRIEPLVSLGVGTFRSRRLSDGPDVGPVCLTVTDVPAAALSPACMHRPTGERAAGGSYPAVSPAVGLRLALLPGLALRADVRDAIVYRGGARHNLELGTGLSFVW